MMGAYFSAIIRLQCLLTDVTSLTLSYHDVVTVKGKICLPITLMTELITDFG